MTRSIWKGPFVDGYMLKKAETARGSKLIRPIRLCLSWISPNMQVL